MNKKWSNKMIRDDLKRHKASQKITNTIVKNTNEKGEWKAIRRLEATY
jgi:hypothetical protein